MDTIRGGIKEKHPQSWECFSFMRMHSSSFLGEVPPSTLLVPTAGVGIGNGGLRRDVGRNLWLALKDDDARSAEGRSGGCRCDDRCGFTFIGHDLPICGWALAFPILQEKRKNGKVNLICAGLRGVPSWRVLFRGALLLVRV